ncbi:MAG TPA: ElyC/SanA/YdcF family protein [Candidatus Saccharimonadales bacterium]|jgi:vancomycin permeability regulator SanA
MSQTKPTLTPVKHPKPATAKSATIKKPKVAKAGAATTGRKSVSRRPAVQKKQQLAAQATPVQAQPAVAASPTVSAAPVAPLGRQVSAGAGHQFTWFSPLLWPFQALWRLKWWLLSLLLIAVCALVAISETVRQSTVDQRYDGNTKQIVAVPKKGTALVLGAGVTNGGEPTPYLKNRIATAVELYKSGRVESLLVSGDDRESHNREATTMKAYAVGLGVDPTDVIVDAEGYSTHDSCKRAASKFGLNSVTVVTQGYHLPRAVMICRDLGLDTVGVSAIRRDRDWTVNYLIREHLATAKAMARPLVNAVTDIVK